MNTLTFSEAYISDLSKSGNLESIADIINIYQGDLNSESDSKGPAEINKYCYGLLGTVELKLRVNIVGVKILNQKNQKRILI